MHIPLDPRLRELSKVPYTISYVIRKLQQIDNLNELPKDKRPPDDIIWDGTPGELDEWLDRVLKDPKSQESVEFIVKDVEG